MTDIPPNFLADFIREEEFCADTGICRKTCQRYRNLPDGLPYLDWGGKTWIGPMPAAREWLLRRVKRRNPSPTKKRQTAA
jgi:hypothetical protein